MKRRSKTSATHSHDEGETHPQYVFSLFVAGPKTKSVRAIASMKKLCEKYMKGHYELEVVDLYRYPARARAEQIIAAPTLIKRLPMPVRQFIGDLSDGERLLVALCLKGDRHE